MLKLQLTIRRASISKVRLNREISAANVRLIGLEGEQLGVVSLADALAQAESLGYDLAEIAPSATPPVAKILDWGKYQYEQTKQLQRSKKHQKQVEVKQIKLGLKIGAHDLKVKQDHAREFLEQGHRVKVTLFFRGREITRQELGAAVIARFEAGLADIAVEEQPPARLGRELNTILTVKKDAKT